MAVDAAQQARNQKALARATRNLGEVLGGIGVGGKAGLADVGVVVSNRVRQKLSTPGTGRTYRRASVVHVASAPGKPPAVDTGRLRASYTWRTGVDARGPYVEIGTNVLYAPFLEFGTRRMAARPHLRPAVNELRKEIVALIRQGIIQEQRNIVRRMPKEIAA
jgi:HK97 gp10 family phage protein